MERLTVHQVQDIVHRLRSGQSERAVVRDVGCARETVRRYARLARENGYLCASAQLPSPSEIEAAAAPTYVLRRTNISSLEPYRSVVEELVKSLKEGTAIHRRLCKNHGYTGSYSSVRRFIAQLRPPSTDAVVRIETAPGRQAQVDFGSIGKVRDPRTGVMRTAYCFVMVLSWSRHMFVRFVFNQRVATWLECHRLAFERFGGITQEVVVDNLKSAVIRASITDPLLSLPYSRFARHYGFLVHPCRPYAPEHKGKVESSVHYVKRNFVASEEFTDIDDANEKVQKWVAHEAGLRIHGTTRERPLARFMNTERASLSRLPLAPFDLEEVIPAKLHRDCHVQVRGCYYSAPFTQIGKTLDVFVYNTTIQIFDGVTLLTTHERSFTKGARTTRPEHYPPDKALYTTRSRSWCRERARQIGPHCLKVVDRLLRSGPLDRLRAIQGIVGLADKYSHVRVDAACQRADHYEDISYRCISAILDSGADQEPISKVVQLQLVNFEYARPASDFFAPEEMTC